jgi:hypothetical protein
MIHAILLRVAPTLSVIMEYVPAYQNIMVTLTSDVVLNVLSAQIAQWTKHVSEIVVLIHVLAHVVRMHFVKWLLTWQFVHAHHKPQEMLLSDVIRLEVSLFLHIFLIFGIILSTLHSFVKKSYRKYRYYLLQKQSKTFRHFYLIIVKILTRRSNTNRYATRFMFLILRCVYSVVCPRLVVLS